jgi:hypothetical protein
MIATTPAPMGVYQGQRRIGEIIDDGRSAGVRGYLCTPARVLIGRYPDRKSALVAVSNAATGPTPPEAA